MATAGQRVLLGDEVLFRVKSSGDRFDLQVLQDTWFPGVEVSGLTRPQLEQLAAEVARVLEVQEQPQP